jgi:hypothetical protein
MVICKSFQTKIKRKKEKKIENGKGPRGRFWPRPGNWPMAQPIPLPELVTSLFSFFTDEWDPHVSTDVVFNLRPKISPEDSVISSP